MLLGADSGKQEWVLFQTTCNTFKRLRDCETLLAGNAPLGYGSRYKDLCVKSSVDSRTFKSMIEESVL